MIRLVICLLAASLLVTRPMQAAGKPVKVFILAGQSNMEGKAPNALFDHQATDPKTQQHFAHLRVDDKWIVRDDVFIKFLDRKGPLTIGYGSRGRTGVELEFGAAMGNHFEEPVILIKAAWGGHSLYKLFRSPSAGFPVAELLRKELDQAQANVRKNNEKNNKNDPLPTLDDMKKDYGLSYRSMLAEVHEVRSNYATLFPALQGETLELAGFVWFQGWNDQYGAQDEYASNLEHFIRDVRKDLRAPNLPFVIAAMGQNGSKPATGAMLTIQSAQLAMSGVPDFQGNVKAIRTDVLVDRAAEELYPTWRENVEQWKLVGGDFAYHYLGSAIWFTRIGHALGDAMLELRAAEVAFQKEQGRLQISIGDKRFMTYVFQDEQIPRPYFMHVQSPSGIQVTRNHPPIKGKDLDDHSTFHPGIWLAFGDLGGADFWRNRSTVKHVEFVEQPQGGSGRGSFAVRSRYEEGKKSICEEVCRISIMVCPSGYLMIWDSTFSSADQDFHFGDQEEMGLGVRLATPLTVKNGGQILNSDGLKNEAQVWGKQADWCDYRGIMAGQRVGLVVMPDPNNFGRSWFHARDYGLLVANPFGRNAFAKSEKSRVVVKKGEPFRLRFGVLVYGDGSSEPPEMKAAYGEFLERTRAGG